MSHVIDEAGYQEAILNSYEDYEPYGFVAPRLATVSSESSGFRRNPVFDRVIEAELLHHSSLVGC